MNPAVMSFLIAALCLLVPTLLLHQFLSEESADAHQMVEQYVTFYTWLDNDPPGNAIAYPHSSFPRTVHEVAGGTGTYADPITTASDPTEWAIGTRMYAPFLRKYLVMEDECEQCIRDWRRLRKHHLDVWMNSNQATGAMVHECAFHWTQDRTLIEINPPRNHPVDTRPLFDTTTNTCLESPVASRPPFGFALLGSGLRHAHRTFMAQPADHAPLRRSR